MIESRIARRYLWAARKQRHTAFLSLISMLGLAVGVATLLISIALLSGLQGQITARLIASSPQVLIEPSASNTIENAEAIVDAARQLGATNVAAVVSGIAWGANQGENRGRPMRIRSDNGDTATAGDAPAIALTRDFAASIGLDAGENVTVVAPRTRLTPFGPVPVVRTYAVGRLLPPSSGETVVDAQLPRDEAAALFGTTGPTSIEIYGEQSAAEPMQSALSTRFPGVQVKTWKEINRPLFLALRLEKIVMFATISLIIFVAALNLISSLSMLIMEKRPAVGVLRTLGASDRTILSIFLQVGLLIGLTGTVLGNVIGVGFAWAANRFQLVPLPHDIYFIPYLPFRLDAIDVAGVNAIAVLLSIFATWYPARVASRLDPITAIREE
ncbi:MAG TPA: FtsX-like permease family protein [Thermoanaerobaculia bacterium]|nr:FtsX-like permease family protein [Thermoanaerobaculia bacterium]